MAEWRPPSTATMTKSLASAIRESGLPTLAQERRHLEEVCALLFARSRFGRPVLIALPAGASPMFPAGPRHVPALIQAIQGQLHSRTP